MNVQGTTVRLSYAAGIAGVARTEPASGAPEVSLSPQSAGPDDDAKLLESIARGDASSGAALEQLFARHSGALMRFMCRVTRNDADAEDIVHDCFVRVVEAAKTYRRESQFRTWLFSMALNLARTNKRKAAVREKADPLVALQEKNRLSARATHADPAQTAQRRELLQRVDGAIGSLSDSEREVFLLYWYGQLSYPEISEMSGVSVAAAKVRVHRAMARLGKLLKGLQ
jgi:RNA polymerase sigma-70 factor (ECF subfamily)